MNIKQNKLTDYEFEKGNIWLKHVFFELIGYVVLSDCYFWSYSDSDYNQLVSDATQLYSFMTDRTFDDLNEIDAILKRFSSFSYSDRPSGRDNGGEKIDFTAEQLARILVNMCLNCSIYWDNGSHTTQEKQYFEKTIFGKAVKDLDCYSISEVQNAAPANPAQKAPHAPRASGGQSPWQQRGPLSDQARGLVGKPHEKIMLSGTVYQVIDPVKSSTNKLIRAIVRPLAAKGDAGNNINKVFVSDANNWGDFVCLFSDRHAAEDFCAKAAQNYKQVAPARWIEVKSTTADSNGYFEVATEYGNAYIRAFGLNEEIQEEVEESFVKPVKKLDEYTLEQVMMYNRD